MITTIFFDLDGVLTTKNNGSLTTCEYISTQTGIPLEKVLSSFRGEFSKQVSFGERTDEEFWPLFCEALGVSLPLTLLDEAYKSTPQNESMFALACELKKKYKIGLITDNGRRRMEVLGSIWNFKELFDSITTSYDVAAFKDNEKIFQLALERLQVSADETVFIDNGEKNLVIPAQMGFKTYYFDETKNDIESLTTQLRDWGVNI